jgi:Tol biopolymer transport system component
MMTKAVFGVALASLLAVTSLAAQRLDPPAADASIFARPTLVAHLRPHVLWDRLDGAVSPDGKSYAYLEADQGWSRLRLLDLATGRSRVLAKRQSHWGITWSPDNKRIAVVGRSDRDSTPSGIWVVDVESGDARLAYGESRYDATFDLVWMRDGRILFSHRGDKDGGVLLSVVDPATGRSALLSQESIRIRSVRISPDGSQLAYLGPCQGDSTWGVRILALADSSRPSHSRCVASIAASAAPVWAPDAQTLYVLATEGNPGGRLFAVNVETGMKKPIDIAGISGDITGISISADGQVMLSAKTTTMRIGTVAAGGGVPIEVQRDTSLILSSPVWSTDGAFVGVIGGTRSGWRAGRAQQILSIAVNAPGSLRGALVPSVYPSDSVSFFAVSPDGHCAVQPVWSFDARVALEPVSAKGPTFLQEVASYGTVSVSGGDVAEHATLWSPDGRFVVKQAWGKLYRADRDSTPGTCRTIGEPRPIALENFQGQPIGWQVSPDGRWLAFARVPTAAHGAGLFIVGSRGGRVRQLRALPNDNSFSAPQWSADGRALYFVEADSARVYRVLRLTIATGAIDTITRGRVGAVHPRLSPDGMTLAVTLVESDLRLWRLSTIRPPGPTVAVTMPVRAPDPPSKPDSALLDLASRIARHASTLETLWPGYWPRTRTYALVAPKGQGMLFVGEQPVLAGFQRLPSVPGLVAPFGAFWKAGPVGDPDVLRIPFALTDSVPGAGSSSAAREQWRERTLFDLFYGTPERAASFRLGKRWDFRPDLPMPDRIILTSCMGGSPESCAAVGQLEQRVLNTALTTPRGQLKAVVRSYVALRWIRRATGGDKTTTFLGVSPYLAHRAAAYVATSDATGYVRGIVAANAAPAPAREEDWEREIRETGNGSTAVLVLLDRLGVRWQRAVQQGEEPFHLLMRAVSFDSAQALAIAKRAHEQYDLSEFLTRAARTRSGSGTAPARPALPNYEQHFHYRRLAQALSNDSLPLVIMPPYVERGAPDTSKTHISFTAGAGDSVSNGRGFVMLPDPDRFVIETAAYRVEVSHVPVVIDPTPGNMPGLVVWVYLPDDVMRQLRLAPPTDPGRPRSASGQHYRGVNYDLLIKPDAYVERVNFAPPIITLSQPRAFRR